MKPVQLIKQTNTSKATIFLSFQTFDYSVMSTHQGNSDGIFILFPRSYITNGKINSTHTHNVYSLHPSYSQVFCKQLGMLKITINGYQVLNIKHQNTVNHQKRKNWLVIMLMVKFKEGFERRMQSSDFFRAAAAVLASGGVN